MQKFLKITFAFLLAYTLYKLNIIEVLAADNEDKKQVVAVGDSIVKKLSGIVSSIFLLIYYVLYWPVIKLVSIVSSNDFVFGDYIKTAINIVWINIRDIVNVLFVFLLLIVAAANIAGLDGLSDKFNMKSSLPRIIIAMILVNFSLFACKLSLDAVNVFTSAAYAIPGQERINEQLKDLKTAKNQPYTVVNYSCGLEREWNCERTYEKMREKGDAVKADCYQKVCEYDRKEGNYHWMEFEDITKPSGYFTVSGDKVTYTEDNILKLERDHVVCHFVIKKADPADTSATDKQINQNPLINVIAARFASLIKPDQFYSHRTDLADGGSGQEMTNYEFREKICPTFNPEEGYSGKLQSSDPNTKKLTTGNSNNLFEFIVNNIFVLVIFVMLFFAFLALLVGLIIRTVVIWLLIAISPFLVAQQILFPGLDVGGEGKPLDIYVNHLVMPLKFAVVIALAFILISTVPSLFLPGAILTATKIFDFVLGKSTDATGVMNIVQHMLYLAMIATLLWTGIWWAFKGTKAEGITGKIREAGNFALKSPQYLPMPVPGLHGMSISGALKAPKAFKDAKLDMIAESDRKAYKSLGISGSNIAKENAKKHKGDARQYLISMGTAGKLGAKDFAEQDDHDIKSQLKSIGITNVDDLDLSKLKTGDISEWTKAETADGKLKAEDVQDFTRHLRSLDESIKEADKKYTGAQPLNSSALLEKSKDKDLSAATKQEAVAVSISNAIYKDKKDEDFSDGATTNALQVQDLFNNVINSTDGDESTKRQAIKNILQQIEKNSPDSDKTKYNQLVKGYLESQDVTLASDKEATADQIDQAIKNQVGKVMKKSGETADATIKKTNADTTDNPNPNGSTPTN